MTTINLISIFRVTYNSCAKNNLPLSPPCNMILLVHCKICFDRQACSVWIGKSKPPVGFTNPTGASITYHNLFDRALVLCQINSDKFCRVGSAHRVWSFGGHCPPYNDGQNKFYSVLVFHCSVNLIKNLLNPG